MLEADHIEPSSKGGSDDEINLITSCADCNRGKSDKKLGDTHPRPDADLKYLETQQEIAEAKRFLESQKELEVVRQGIYAHLDSVWEEYLLAYRSPTQKQWGAWLSWNSPEEVDFAIRRASGKYQSGALEGSTLRETCDNCIRYVSGILKSRAQEIKNQNGRNQI